VHSQLVSALTAGINAIPTSSIAKISVITPNFFFIITLFPYLFTPEARLGKL
jgi:hypothetical protein